MDVVYDGIRLTPEEIVERAKTGVHCVGLSILSGSHLAMTREVLALLKAAGLSRIPVVVGGIIPPGDAELLRAEGVAAIYTPKDFAINKIIGDIVAQVERSVFPASDSSEDRASNSSVAAIRSKAP
jgi:(2R)-ethylmalonyl-CoA mutase